MEVGQRFFQFPFPERRLEHLSGHVLALPDRPRLPVPALPLALQDA